MLPDRQWVGGMVFDESGDVICGGRDGIVALDPHTGETRSILTEVDGKPVIAVNDMEADGRGGFFAGTIDFVSIMEKGEPPAPGAFFHMSAEGDVTVLRRDVFASNGIAFSPCGKWLYHSETSRGIWRYPLADNGLPGAGDLLVSEEDGDGLAVDREGNLWLACWSTGRLMHYSPEGAALQALSFPYPHIVSIAFGASDPTSLYIATGGNEDVRKAGAVLRMKVEVAGLAGARSSLRAMVK
ncbi:gluconolaconase [Novosphingobium malaysiense]|uniref:Gluconolaconase n=2 Tax=Novosphingobium malaysiense TaxID=1348853 RepID=A0A0B1ZR60_9SPHN|nr:gluconolaconase [Novosphingobium malaysiense]